MTFFYVWVQVQLLNNPSIDEFRQVLESFEPNIVYLQGEQIADSEEIGSLVLGEVDLSTPEALCGVFGSTFPTTVSDDARLGYDLDSCDFWNYTIKG